MQQKNFLAEKILISDEQMTKKTKQRNLTENMDETERLTKKLEKTFTNGNQITY